MIRVKRWLQKVSFYLGLGLLLYSFKSNHAPGSILTPEFFSLKIEEAYTFMNISWAEMSRNLEISFKCIVQNSKEYYVV